MFLDFIKDCFVLYFFCECVGDFVVEMSVEVVFLVILYGIFLCFGVLVVYMINVVCGNVFWNDMW